MHNTNFLLLFKVYDITNNSEDSRCAYFHSYHALLFGWIQIANGNTQSVT